MNIKSSIAACLTVVGALMLATLAPVTAAAAPSATRPASATAKARSITLITGDRIMLPRGDTSRYVVRPAKGRERITFLTQRAGKRLWVTPSDAVALLQAGRLDRRVFDVSTLLEYGYDDRRTDLPLIVTYADGARAAGDTWTGARTTRVLPAARAQAVLVRKTDAGAFWRGLSNGGVSNGGVSNSGLSDGGPIGGQARTLAAGRDKVWLDGLRNPTLDESVSQIGAPAAWQAGFTGAGVTVAVVDTGIDATHPDLAGRVAAQKNFTEDPTTATWSGTAPTWRRRSPAAVRLRPGATRARPPVPSSSTPRSAKHSVAPSQPSSPGWSGPR